MLTVHARLTHGPLVPRLETQIMVQELFDVDVEALVSGCVCSNMYMCRLSRPLHGQGPRIKRCAPVAFRQQRAARYQLCIQVN